MIAATSMAERLRQHLVRQVDVHDAATVADFGGVSVKTLGRYLRGDTEPGGVTVLNLMHQCPISFAAPLLSGLGIIARPADGTCSPAAALQEIVEGAAALARAWADLRIDHCEWPAVRAELVEAMVSIGQLIAAEDKRLEAAR